jgi:5'-3' exonuclease
LLGSDYTEGVNGIGIVNAMEIIAAFPGDSTLLDFRTWFVVVVVDDDGGGVLCRASQVKSLACHTLMC